MSISHKLEMKQGQQLVMTPQLQQAIKLLQLTNLELQEYVESQLLENPFLERDERASQPERGDGSSAPKGAEGDKHEGEQPLSLTEQSSPKDAAGSLDTDYENLDPGASRAEKYESMKADNSSSDWSSVKPSRAYDLSDLDMDANLTRVKSLQEHLTEQLHLALRNEMQLMIGSYLIDLIDEGGYLRDTTEEVAERLGTSDAEVVAVLDVIHGFEPAGVGARNLSECLRLQLKELNRLDERMDVFLEYLHLLGASDLPGLKKATGFNEEELQEMIAEVRSLTPKPGLAYGSETVQVVVPDVFVGQAEDGGWKIELNSETLPRVIANQKYFAKLTSTCAQDDEKSYITEQMSNASWLVKSLDQRARTILKVSSEIVRQQDAFFIHGVKYLKPLNLKVVADAIGMHESTVSRVTSGKYMATSRGSFELKYFFTSAIAATTGDVTHSAESVRHRIRELIEAEKAQAILSDDRIVELLKVENIDIARRTVAKYREAMHIPSSVQRRRLKQRAI
ncbi:RNA polymerase factor sigma-54 [Parvularcula sp. IMCC14364]|uniref:RNA polymerase factor sigma-54 n=1 Tax=Parvularcula sp. IMCC14364 TaxID=3067902 RepID=UPI002740B763|nr:RNA polymerase factor sigma-54 [Parvularcula sp. IMCC14364]